MYNVARHILIVDHTVGEKEHSLVVASKNLLYVFFRHHTFIQTATSDFPNLATAIFSKKMIKP